MADSTQAQALTEGLPAEYPLADKGYDTNAIVARAIAQGMEPVIPPRRHRKEPRDYDRDLYRLRHLVENAFLNFKQWGGGNSLREKIRLLPRHLPDSGSGNLDQTILTTPPTSKLLLNDQPRRCWTYI